ncbi:hypothetical protein AB0M10_29010 [Streptomyces sp. NPDC051840]|uniref:hypothetical protein n=1 Tax=Streptomyces sp. NPDC051840 TaxID=3154752 RepID=UPI003428E992
MATLDELFDTAAHRLRTAAAVPSSDRPASALDIDRFLSTLAEPLVLGGEDAPRSTVTGDLIDLLRRASDTLRSARRLLPAPGDAPVESHISDASAAVHAVRDIIENHRGPDRVPLTAYAYALTTGPAHHYLTRRCAELAWESAQVVASVGRDVLDPSVADAFADAHRFLSQAAVFGQAGTPDAETAIGALSMTLPVSAVQAEPTDRTQDVTANLEQDCDRLSRAAFETLHSRTDHRLSGSDLQQLARWTAMQRLLAGRVLLQVAESLPGQTADALRDCADVLRGSAQAWQKTTTAWHRVVDVSDPRAHPALPTPNYEIVRRGELVRLPQVLPHPATAIAHTAAVRVGQLLYGPQWKPETAATRPEPRKGSDILSDAQGTGALAAALYRLPATGWQLALAAPQAVSLARGGLVTDIVENRIAGPTRHRFRPLEPHRLEALALPYQAVLPAEQASAASLLGVAGKAGVPVPRALLDATAHQMLAAAATGWGKTPARQAATADRSRLRVTAPQVRVRRRVL